MRWRHPARLVRRPLISPPLLLLDSQPKPEPPGQGDALAAPGAAGSPTPAQPAAPALDSQPKPEPPGQGDAPVRWHPARLDRPPLLSLPLLLPTASPSLNRLARAMRPWRWHPARLDRPPLLSLPLLLPTASPSLNRLARAMRPALAPGAAGSPTPAQPAAPAPDSQPKPEPPGQGDAPVALAPGAAGSPTPAQPAAPAPDSQPKPEPPGQGDAPGAAGSPTPDQPAAPAPDSQPKPEPPGQGDAPVRWHPARLVRRPLLSLPLLPSTASPSLNRLARAMRPGAGTRRGWFADPCSACRSCPRQPAQA